MQMKIISIQLKSEAIDAGYQLVYELFESLNKMSTKPIDARDMKQLIKQYLYYFKEGINMALKEIE